MPFAGRHSVKGVSEACIKERYTRQKVAKTLGGLAFMGAMVWAHARQADMGASAFMHDTAELAAGDDSALRHAEAAYDAIYCGANAAVTAAQAYIGYRMGKSLLRNLRKPPLIKPYEVGIDVDTPPQRPTYPAFEVGIDIDIPQRRSFAEWRKDNDLPLVLATDTAVTLGGQAAFLASFFH